MNTSNNHFETPDLGLAAYLIIHNVEYLGVRWLTPNQAVFTFRSPPPDALYASWLNVDGDKFRKFRKAIEQLKDGLFEGGKR